MTIGNYLDSEYLIGAATTLGITTLAVGLDSHLRQGQSILENTTVAKVMRTALYTIASLIPVVTASCSRDSASVLLSLIGSAVCVFASSQIRDYEDHKELQIMRIAASAMSFNELKNTHGLKHLVKYQMVTNLPEKFIAHYNPQTFSRIEGDHSLSEIAQYNLCPLTPTGYLHNKFVHELSARRWDFLRERNLGNGLYANIMSPAMYDTLVNLQNELGEIDKTLRRSLSDLDTYYSERTEIQLKKFADRERNIPYRARQFGETVASKASGTAVNTAVVNAVWDGNTQNIFRDAGTGFNVAEAAGKHAEQAELERLRAELQRDRADPILIARGASQQKDYEIGCATAHQIRVTNLAFLEVRLTETLGL